MNDKDGDALDNPRKDISWFCYATVGALMKGGQSIFEVTPSSVNPVDRNRHAAHVQWTSKGSLSYLPP